MATALTTNDGDFDALSHHVSTTFASALAGDARLFLTDADGLFDAYLDALSSERQEHNCHACCQFLSRFGGLVVVDQDGRLRSANKKNGRHLGNRV